MKHTKNYTIMSLKKSALVALFVPATIIAFTLLLILRAAEPHDAELRFSEKSDNIKVLGNMLPASCESGGNDLAGPGHVSGCVWTSYCTNIDPNGNSWQIWQYSNDDSTDYRYSGVNCVPSTNIYFPY